MRIFEARHGHTALLVDERKQGTQVTVSHEGRGVTVVLDAEECARLAAVLINPREVQPPVVPCSHTTRGRSHYARMPSGEVVSSPGGRDAHFGAAGTVAPVYLGLLCDPCAVGAGLTPVTP